MPQLRAALARRVVVEQAKGFLRERLDVPVEEAFAILRAYARRHDQHLTEVARRLVSERQSRPETLASFADLVTR
jgi:AmiR/NasT family two-component response regulator